MQKLNLWINPKNNEKRVYLSNPHQVKLFFVECEKDQFGYDYKICIFAPNKTYGEQQNLINQAEEALDQIAGKRIMNFAEILELAK